MKKHKKIGVVIALLVVSLLGVTSIVWYKNNVFIGAQDVQAKNPMDSYCPNVAPGGVDIERVGDFKWEITGPVVPYDVRIYIAPGGIADQLVDEANDARKNNKDVTDMATVAAADSRISLVDTVHVNGGTKTIDTSKYQRGGNPNNKILLDIHLTDSTGKGTKDEKIYWCGRRHDANIVSFGTESNSNNELCNQWFSGEKFTYTNGKFSETLNSDIDKYIADGTAEEFRAYKEKMAGGVCADGGESYDPVDAVKSFIAIEKNFAASKTLENSLNSTKNPDIGNPDDYEDRTEKGTTIDTLYCKVNSVYLKDIDSEGKDRLEDSNTNGLALKSENAGKENTLESSGNARANLYLFKYTQETSQTYNVYSNGEVVDTPTACSVSCTEYVKVNFDPPQEVTAGTCFSYAVQVIASTECTPIPSDDSGPVPPQPASYRADCDHGSGYTGSIGAGPSEDYDKCIADCDGGKYSKKCSNECFNKVYGESNETDNIIVDSKKTVKKLNYFTKDIKMEFMADVVDNETPPPVNADPNTVRAFFLTHPSGYFTGESPLGGPIFISNYPGYYWAQYAPFYFTDDHGWETLLSHDMNFKTNGYSIPCNDSSQCEPQAPSCTTGTQGCKTGQGGQNGGAGFLVDVNAGQGECKLNYENPVCEDLCDAECKYVSDGGVDPITAEQAYKDFELSSASYNEALAKCTSTAACKSTSETKSTFYIGVNDDEDKWKATNDTGSTKEPEHSGKGCVGTAGDLIIQGRDSTSNNITDGTGGLCYCGNEDYNEWQHYTRWTFPGRWVDKKSNKVTDQPPKEGAEGFYDGGYNKYCIDKNEKKDVNVNWLEQLINNKNQYETEKDARLHMTEQGIEDWNISARTEHFGNYDWTISTKCFYSLTTKTIKIDPPEDPSDPDNPSTSDTPADDTATPASISSANIKIKTADPKNPIPAKGKSKGDLGDGRNESWNWSEAATKMDVELDNPTGSSTLYEITPGAYREYMEDLGDDVFKGDTYLDYGFKFTGSDLKEIADNVKTNNKFGDFSSGKVLPISGYKKNSANKLSTYYSTYIRSLGVGSVIKMPDKSAVVCNNLDSSSGNAKKCSDTSSDIPTTSALAEFKSKIKK